MLTRYSSRKTDLGKEFMKDRLKNAIAYDRIAGYFCSSVLEIAGEEIENIEGKVRVICNSGLNVNDVKTAALAAQRVKQEWCGFEPEDKYTSLAEAERLLWLYELLSSGKMEIKVLPDEVYGLMHGKAGVITYKDGSRISFVGSMNETKSAMTTNYEIVWQDDSPESADWVQKEFDYFWNHKVAVPLCDYVINDFERIGKRHVKDLKGWREHPDAQAVVVEEPISRKEFGLWAHQKYFVMRAFEEHKTRGGARLLLADMVGLGKTLQLAMTAKLMALYGKDPILIIVPKTLIWQWQDELKDMLDMPTAVWDGKCWVDENGFDYNTGILGCPRKVGIVSQGIITAKTHNAQLLLQRHYECVICDEAHRARRKNFLKDKRGNKPDGNNLLKFLYQITFQTKSMLLATATPVQMYPIEAYDLLYALGMPQTAEKVLGNKHSWWRTDPLLTLDFVSGEDEPTESDANMWSIMRNPFPQKTERNRLVGELRSRMDVSDDQAVLPAEMYSELSRPIQNKLKTLFYDDGFIDHLNPYVRCIVRRDRAFLENTINKETGEPYLKKITVQLYGEKPEEALELTGYMEQAYRIAEEFCDMLSKRVRGGGFMSTMLLKRIGSTMVAGESTAKKMLSWSGEDLDENALLLSMASVMDDEDEPEEAEDQSEMKNLTQEEINCVKTLVKVLSLNRDTDPKYLRVKDILINGVEDEGGWLQKGCIIFSQYFDSARYIAETLSNEFKDLIVGLYAGGNKSGTFENGVFKKTAKDELKAKVRKGELTLLVGTDSASEGLNLQRLSTLINLDLPWNPTRLEQRKGRIQRIGQIADTILIYNMRYKDSVEDKVHTRLSGRLQAVFDMFGQIPEVLEDVWVAMAHNDEAAALEAINKMPAKNPFKVKYEMDIPDMGDWDKCSEVLDKQEKYKELMKGW